MSFPVPLARKHLEGLPRTALGVRSALKPSVWRIDAPGGSIVVKDVQHARFATRWLARWLLARERKVLGRLSGMDGVPQLVPTSDADMIALTLLPGRELDKLLFRERPREIVEQLFELTERLHARGVYHLDLHQRRNLLLDEQGRLHLVDFGSAVAPGPILRALVGAILRHTDRQAAYKYLARFAPEALSEEEARAVLRHRKLRRLWPFTPHSRREMRAARTRLR